MRARIKVAEQNGRRVALSALTPLEVRRTGQAGKRLTFLLSRFDVRPVDDTVIHTAGRLLDATGLDGHECLVDAIVVATAALCLPPVRLVTSDNSHIPKLCTAALDLPGQPAVTARKACASMARVMCRVQPT
ncbi:hypothetical protein [Streptomyces flaveus]|uniref:PIN domain-containing protein n=1 Tax=Streptomyces flaveus TaxID=66370 RepID=A0A917QH63_9ACTN|nr:hypothetical protein [Streptomyces flaveus]GGK51064.1 hypothetical protein GCM10010094_09090 [Streptomyces flaveus]